MLLPGLPWDTFFQVFDAPLPALAIPGFVGGLLFSLVLSVAGRRQRLDELSLPLVAGWGALGGFLLVLVPMALVGLGLASTEGASVSLWRATAVISVPFIVLSACSAAGSLLLARRSARGSSLSREESAPGRS